MGLQRIELMTSRMADHSLDLQPTPVDKLFAISKCTDFFNTFTIVFYFENVHRKFPCDYATHFFISILIRKKFKLRKIKIIEKFQFKWKSLLS
jgi:hypothetical protein